MSLNSFLVSSLQSAAGILKATVGDFSDADFFSRPAPAANHGNWQLGHLIASQHGMMSAVGAKCPALPEGFQEKYKKETAGEDDPAAFVPKGQLLALYDQVHEATVAFAKDLTAEQLDAAGPEKFRQFAATVADVVGVQSMHASMHVGQFQVLRRKLGKPILF